MYKLLLILSFFFLVFVFESCSEKGNIATYKKETYHFFLSDSEFKKLDRPSQLNRCKKCHLNEVKNEEKGPHSVSHFRLEKHIIDINSENYNEPFYKEFVNLTGKNCLGCHSPKDNLNSSENNLFSKKMRAFQIVFEKNVIPTKRNNFRNSGIDCISCHVFEDKIVALKSIEKQGKFTKIDLIENNLNCYPCHKETFDSYDYSNTKVKKSFSCNTCHIESVRGKKTHYFYWKNYYQKQNSINILLDFSVKKSRNQIVLSWENKSIPHKLNSCPEFLFQIDFLNQKSKVLKTDLIRVNNMTRFNDEMCSYMKGNKHFGIQGIEIPENKVIKKFNFQDLECDEITAIKLTYSHKAQFWSHDSTKVVKRIRILNLVRGKL